MRADVPVYDIVIPTVGRPSLDAVLAGVLAPGDGPMPRDVVVVDDSRGRRGPAAARNAGWSATSSEWVVFLDDDVVLPPGWRAALARDLAAAGPDVAGVQATIRVPLPSDRRPTDAERNVAGLETARWATADMAFRRRALESVGGFDERFPRAYREDADLALRLLDAGWTLVRGERVAGHPARPSSWTESIRRQRGNADDALVRRLHGRRWRERAGAPPGAFRSHAVTTAALVGAIVGPGRRVRMTSALAWATLTARFAWTRVAPGPRAAREVATMLATSAAIPPTAVWHRATGELQHRGARPRPHAVLFDRDGTLVVDVPYNGDPDKVRLMPDAREALERVRAAGLRTAVVSNQSGIARGVLTGEQVAAVNDRVEELLGAPLGPWVHCPHGPDDACDCRKPEPGMIRRAAQLLGVDPARVAVIGDIGADMEAARRAGARGVLVPTVATRREEVEAAPEVASSLVDAVDRLLGARR
jgi:histidinol-phosphate phosphatase family protein